MPGKKSLNNAPSDISVESVDNALGDNKSSFNDLLSDPRVKAIQAYQQLPPEIRRRVKAMKKLQFESYKLESDFFRRMNELEREFQERFTPIYKKRCEIITGENEPTDSDCDWEEKELDLLNITEKQDIEKLAEKLTNQAVLRVESGDDGGVSTSLGIPNFWLTIFNNVPVLVENKEECDDPILATLRDIKCFIQPADSKRPGFYLEFHFAPNDYFTNTVLRKDYFVRFDPPAKDPLSYEGPEIIESQGTEIHWKPGKNVTVRTIKKTMKNKHRGEKKTITKTVKTDSFFYFFAPPAACIDDLQEDNEGNEDLEEQLHADFELGQYIREQVIPRAVLLYTGEGIEMDDDEDFDSEEEDDEDDEDDHRPNRSTRGKRVRASSGEEQSCKQQ